jgi:hypothetical protein
VAGNLVIERLLVTRRAEMAIRQGVDETSLQSPLTVARSRRTRRLEQACIYVQAVANASTLQPSITSDA